MVERTAARFPTILKLYKYEIERMAMRLGLKFRDVIYEMVETQEMSEVVARHGFPVMPHHWRVGQESIFYKQRFRLGAGRFFEIVINTNPVYAFLLDTNHLYDQKAVIAHVCGHADMFCNSFYAHPVHPNMEQMFAADAFMIDRFLEEYGQETVKKWYDWVLSLENLFDPDALFFARPPLEISPEEREARRAKRKHVHRLEPREELPPYLDEFLNPPTWIDEQRIRAETEEAREREIERGTTVPPYPMRDVIHFLIKYAPLEGWQRAILEMVRRHKYFFSQYRTKFVHEGWASYWEEEIMFSLGASQDRDLTRWVATLAKVQRAVSLNPYLLLYQLLKDIEFRWNTGRHGNIWDRCDIVVIKERWDEFVVFHGLRLASQGDMTEFYRHWAEFSTFIQALKKGELGYPEELFVREAFTEELLIPTWVRYGHASEELAGWREQLQQIQKLGLEDKIPAEVARMRGEVADPSITDEELGFKARRDLYFACSKEHLYLWTPREILGEIRALEALLAFEAGVDTNLPKAQLIPIPPEWWEYSSRFSESVKLGVGRAKIFEVRATYDDYNVFDEFFTREFCERNRYFLAKAKTVWPDWVRAERHYVIETRAFERIKKRLLFMFTNFNSPVITVEDANYRNNRELYLKHHHSGVDLDFWSKDGMFVRDVLERIFRIWGGKKRVYIETIVTKKEEERPWWFSWHGTEEKEGGENQELTGTRVVFSYGFKVFSRQAGMRVEDYESEEEEFRRENLGEVVFKAPF